MDINNGNEETTIDWERETIIYQNALEAALQLQRDLEQTIHQQKREISHLQKILRVQKEEISQKDETITHLQQATKILQKALRKQNEDSTQE